MGYVEKYGLIALVVLCVLIIGVGLLSEDGAYAKQRKQQLLLESQQGDAAGQSSPGVASAGAGGGAGEETLEGMDPAEFRDDELARAVFLRRQEEAQHSKLRPEFSSSEGPAGEGGLAAGPRKIPGQFPAENESQDPGTAGDPEQELEGLEDGPAGQRPSKLQKSKLQKKRSDGPRLVDPAPSSTEQGFVLHKIRKGDFFGKLAKRYYGHAKATQIDRIRDANPKVSDTGLIPGKTLRIPLKGMKSSVLAEQRAANKGSSSKKSSSKKGSRVAKRGKAKTRSHKVRKGDNLTRLSRRYYGSERYGRFLARFNGIQPGAILYPGTVLRIPATPPR